jgi:hypothetical protein
VDGELGFTLGIASPWVIAQVSALAAKWSLKISQLLYDLLDSLRRLLAYVRQVDEYTAAFKARPRGTHQYNPGDPHTAYVRDRDGDGRPDRLGGDLFNRSGPHSNMEILEGGGGIPMTQETVADIARRAGVDLHNVNIYIVGLRLMTLDTWISRMPPLLRRRRGWVPRFASGQQVSPTRRPSRQPLLTNGCTSIN